MPFSFDGLETSMASVQLDEASNLVHQHPGAALEIQPALYDTKKVQL